MLNRWIHANDVSPRIMFKDIRVQNDGEIRQAVVISSHVPAAIASRSLTGRDGTYYDWWAALVGKVPTNIVIAQAHSLLISFLNTSRRYMNGLSINSGSFHKSKWLVEDGGSTWSWTPDASLLGPSLLVGGTPVGSWKSWSTSRTRVIWIEIFPHDLWGLWKGSLNIIVLLSSYPPTSYNLPVIFEPLFVWSMNRAHLMHKVEWFVDSFIPTYTDSWNIWICHAE